MFAPRPRVETRAEFVDEARVVLVDMSEMLRGILGRVLAGYPRVRVAAEYRAVTSLLQAVDAHGANCVIFGDGDSAEQTCRELLDARPFVKLLVVAAEGRRTTLYELRPHKQSLGELSPEQLVGAIKSAIARPAEAW